MSRKRMPKPWRKLFTQEPSDFAELSVYTRGLAAILLKKADEDGFVATADESMVERVARRVGANRGDRRRLGEDINDLLKDGYLVVQDGRLYIRNMVAFQGVSEEVPESGKAIRTRARVSPVSPDCLTSNEPVSPDCLPTVSPVSNESLSPKEGVSVDNHSGPVHGNDPHRGRGREEGEKRESRSTPQPPVSGVVLDASVRPPVPEPEPVPSSVPVDEPEGYAQNRARWRRAYSEGVSQATAMTYKFPSDLGERRDLEEALEPLVAGKTQDQAEAWICETAARYVNATRSRSHFQCGYSPRKFIEWLNTGMPEQAVPVFGSNRSSSADRQPGLHKQPVPEGAVWNNLDALLERQERRKGAGQ
jgi:hypothetical protein